MERIESGISGPSNESDAGSLCRAANSMSVPGDDLNLLFELRMIESADTLHAPQLTALGKAILRYLQVFH